MNKKKRIAILFAVIIILAVGIIIAVASHQKKEMDFDEFADRLPITCLSSRQAMLL